MFTKSLSAVLSVCIAVSATAPRASAQDAKDFAQGFLRALIESQLEKQRRKNQQLRDPFRDPNRGNLRPGQMTAEMQKLRPITASLMQETTKLNALLNTDARRSYEVRRHQTPALQFRAAATALNQQAGLQTNHLALLESYRQLNSDWTALSHQLENCRGLSNPTRACMKRIAKLDGQYCSIFGIEPQFNNTELMQEAHRLETHMHDLDDDVARQGFSHGANNNLRRILGRNHQEAAVFDQLVSGGRSRFEDIVTSYQQVHKTWLAIQNDLNQLQGHHISRNVRRVQESHERIHNLLGLEIGINTDLLLHLVHETHEELGALSRSITLEQLMTLPDAAAVPAAFADADGMIENLDSVLHINESPQSIAEAWVYADESWNVLSYYLSAIRNAQTQQLLATISQNIQSVKLSLGVSVAFDRSEMRRLAHHLEEQAGLLVQTIQDWQKHPGNHNRNLAGIAQNIVTQSYNLETALHRNRSPAQCRQLCDNIIKLWQQIRPELNKCDTHEKATLDHIAAAFTPDLIRLRTMLGE